MRMRVAGWSKGHHEWIDTKIAVSRRRSGTMTGFWGFFHGKTELAIERPHGKIVPLGKAVYKSTGVADIELVDIR